MPQRPLAAGLRYLVVDDGGTTLSQQQRWRRRWGGDKHPTSGGTGGVGRRAGLARDPPDQRLSEGVGRGPPHHAGTAQQAAATAATVVARVGARAAAAG